MRMCAMGMCLPFLIAGPTFVNAQDIRCIPIALDLGISEIPGLVEAVYRPKGHLDVRCSNASSAPVALNVVVYDSMPQPHRLGKDRSRDHILLWLFSDEARTERIGETPEKGLKYTILLQSGDNGNIRFPLFPQLHLPKMLPAGDWSLPMTLKVQWKIEPSSSTSAL